MSKPREIRDRVFIILGGIQGLGLEYAEELLRNGALVSLADLLTPAHHATLLSLSSKYGKHRVFHFYCDITNVNHLPLLWTRTEIFFQRPVFGLVHSGSSACAGVADMWYRVVLDMNLFQPMAINYFAQERFGQSGGIIVNTVRKSNHAATDVSTAGIICLTRSMANKGIFEKTGVEHCCILLPAKNPVDLNEDILDKYSGCVTKVFGGNRSDDMEKCGAGNILIEILKNGCNGSVLVASDESAPFFIPQYFESALFYWLAFGSLITSKLLDIKYFGLILTLIYAAITVIIMNYLITFTYKVIICVIISCYEDIMNLVQ